MGKSNNLHNKFKKIYQRENHLNNFLKEDEIQKLENVNNFFIDQIVQKISDFIKNNVRLISYSTKIQSYDCIENSKKDLKNIRCINLIKMMPENKNSIIVFSSEFLSVMIDLFFGGNCFIKNAIDTKSNIAFSEFSINKKIIKFILVSFSDGFKKFFSKEINLIHVKMVIYLKEHDFIVDKIFIINCFNLIINNRKVFFTIFIPLSIIKKNIKKLNLETIKNKNLNQDVLNAISLDNVSDFKLNIIAKLNNISISHDKIRTLSVGDILMIKKPDRVIGYIEKKPVFLASYKRFNKQSIIFIKDFIDKNLKSNKKRNAPMSDLDKISNNKDLIDSEKKKINDKNLDDNSKTVLNNKKIILDTELNVTVELGKLKIKIKDILNFSEGSMLVLDKLTTEPLDIFINNRLFGSGELVFLDQKYGLRIINIKKSLNNVNILV